MIPVFRRTNSQPPGVARLDVGNPLARGIAAWQTGVDLNGFNSSDIGIGHAPVVPTPNGLARNFRYDASVGLFQWLLRSTVVIQPITSTIVCLARVNADYVQTNGAGTFGLAGLTRSAGGLNAIYLSGTNDGTTSQYEFNVYAASPSPTSLRTLVSTIPVDSEWHLFIGRNTSATSRDFWIDGRLQASDTVSSQPYQPNQFNIGSVANLNQFGNGDVALTLFYNRALTNAEIASISRNPWQVFASQSQHLPLDIISSSSITGTLAATETGSDSFASTGAVRVSGSLAATETGSDSFDSTGAVRVAGSLATTEVGADSFAGSGGGIVAGSLAATETGADSFASTGAVRVAGSLAATETGADSFASTGAVQVAGSLAATEVGADSFASTGAVQVAGSLAATETGTDSFAATGAVRVAGSLVVTEAGTDTFAGSGANEARGSLTATEVGSDTASSTGKVLVSGALAATEAADSFTATGSVLVRGSLAASETGSDEFSASGILPRTGSLAASEVGSDTATVSGRVRVLGTLLGDEFAGDTASATGVIRVQGSLAASEVGSDTFAATGRTTAISGPFAAVESTSDSFSAIGPGAIVDANTIYKLLANRQELDPVAGKFRVYQNDGITVFMEADAWEDAAGTVRYRGTVLRRIDRLGPV
jgi:hypothetical protein